MAVKRCYKCKGPGPFYRDRTRWDGLDNKCKKCRGAYKRKHRRLTGRASEREGQRAYERRHRRRIFLSWRYGLALSDYDAMLAAQSHQCAYCPATTYDRRCEHLAGQMDPTIKKLAALICHRCHNARMRALYPNFPY
jgi:hypothetical protein